MIASVVAVARREWRIQLGSALGWSVMAAFAALAGTVFAVAGFLFPWFLCFLANQYGVLAGRVSDVTELGYEGDFSERE